MEQDWNVYAVYTVVVETEMVVAETIVVGTFVVDKVMGGNTTWL
jgi:hypothetical protein